MAEEILGARGLEKRFGKVVVADGLDLTVAANEALGIIGPNGAGKSSLFNLLGGDLRPDAGTVLLAGEDVTRHGPFRRARAGIGRTYQVPRPFQGMTVFENVQVASVQGAVSSGRTAERRAWRSIEVCGLADVADLPAARLGLLQRKRLEVARALGTAPKVLLLDEVAGGLTDPEVDELVDLITGVRDSGVAVVWIEHVVRALRATVDRLLCLAGGVVIAEGTVEEVLAHEGVRRLYLGASPDDTADAA